MHRLRARSKHCRALGAVIVLSTMLTIIGCGAENTGGGVQESPIQASGTITGRVVSLANNAPVSGATVRTDSSTTTTAADGTFNVTAPVGEHTMVRVEADGFASAFPITRVASGQLNNLGVKLVPIGIIRTVSVAEDFSVSVPNSTARLTIPANSLVPQTGGTPASSVTVALTPLNPAVDTSLMPGGFNGISSNGGSTIPLESFGVLLIDIRDSSGMTYTLAQGKTASIRIPLGTQSASPPPNIPLWFFDETEEVWRQEGTATLRVSGSNRFYEGSITRITYWNADQVVEPIVVTGCVKDANGRLVANAFVQTEGIDYTGTAADVTAADGTFSVAMRKGSQAMLRVIEFDPQTFALVSLSNIVKVGPSSTGISLSNCLVQQPGPLTITTTALLPGKAGDAYNQTMAASGGVPGYVWSLNAGSIPLPDGMMLNPTGVLSGTPTQAETKTIIVKVTDSTGAATTKEFALAISKSTAPPLSITTAVIPVGIVGRAYTATMMATGGMGTTSWSISSGKLPDGLTLDTASGIISGAPTTVGVFPFIITVQDRGTPQQSAQQPLTLVIVSSSGGTSGGNGTLQVSHAPLGVGGTFVVDPANAQVVSSGTIIGILVGEIFDPANPHHSELLNVGIDLAATNRSIAYQSNDPRDGHHGWVCASNLASATCSGLTINRSAGTVTFENVVLVSDSLATAQSVTLKGTLEFAPF